MKNKYCFLLLMLVVLCLTGCRKKEAVKSDYSVYYLNKEETTIVAEPFELTSDTAEEKVEELLQALETTPGSVDLKTPMPEGVKLLKYSIDNKQLYLDYTAEYMEMNKAYEVLARAAVVHTMCQLDEISYIGFQVAGQPLTDTKGNSIGLMNANTFLDNMGSEENATKIVKLDLYYANKAGDKLKDESCVLEYNANVPVEKVVVEQLISGPAEDGFYPTIPADTKIISITTKEGVCYLNLDSGFTAQGYDVLGSVTIYSIVNSLTELSNIDSVQILVNGETNLSYKNNISLETIFQRNTEIVEEEKASE